MSLGYHYKLIDDTYYLYDEDERLIRGHDEVAICFSYDEELCTLHKHGDPEMVTEWMIKNKKRYEESGLYDLANELTVIQGKFPVEEINRILSTTGYIRPFLKKFNLLVVAATRTSYSKPSPAPSTSQTDQAPSASPDEQSTHP